MARPIAKDHDDKRQAILKTAARVFSEEGMARASMSQVAQECGISKANIYHYYDSKDRLLFHILETYLRTLRDRIKAVPAGATDPKATLRAMLFEILRTYQGMDHEHKIQIEAMPMLSEDQQRQLRGYQREMVAEVSGLLSKLAPQVFVAAPQKLKETTMSVFGMLNWYFMWKRNANESERRDYAELIANLVVHGLRGL